MYIDLFDGSSTIKLIEFSTPTTPKKNKEKAIKLIVLRSRVLTCSGFVDHINICYHFSMNLCQGIIIKIGRFHFKMYCKSYTWLITYLICSK